MGLAPVPEGLSAISTLAMLGVQYTIPYTYVQFVANKTDEVSSYEGWMILTDDDSIF